MQEQWAVWEDSVARCHLPFADSEGDDDLDVIDDGEQVGEIDTTDTGDLDEFEEDADSIDKCIRKSIQHAIEPKRQYIKALTQDQYDKIIGKDAYAFLHGHEEEVIEVLAVGKEVSEFFKTLSAIDVREVYRIIITNLEKMGWSETTMIEELMDKFPTLEKYQAERIIQTEVTRVIMYCKEFIAERGDLGEYNYGWVGPLDYRTTPMCYYLQTGKLRDSDLKALKRAGHSVEELPLIPEEGMPLEELKECCRRVAYCFGSNMISDWVMHINCRHTFARGNRRLDIEYADQSEIEQTVQELINMPGGVGSEPTYVDLEPITEEDKMYIPVYDGFESMVFMNSIYDVPVMYDEATSDSVYVFEEMNEKDVASWARMVLQLQDEGLDDEVIIWAIEDMGNIEDDTIAYIVSNAEAIYQRAENEGWI